MDTLHEVAKTSEINEGEAKLVEMDDTEIALFNLGGEFYAIANECCHIGGSLCDGDIDGHKVICPWHGAEFDIKTGKALADPAEVPLESYPVTVDGDTIKVEV